MEYVQERITLFTSRISKLLLFLDILFLLSKWPYYTTNIGLGRKEIVSDNPLYDIFELLTSDLSPIFNLRPVVIYCIWRVV